MNKHQEQHYLVDTVSIEKAEAIMDEFESSAFGQRFLKSCQKSKDFRQKKDNGMTSREYTYFKAMSSQGDFFEAVVKVYDFAYRKGYEKAKRDLSGGAK